MSRRHIVAALTGVAFIGLGTILLEDKPSEATYLTAPVERGDLSTVLAVTGTLSALVTVEVGSQLSGQVGELSADFNDDVTKGDPLAKLDSRTFESEVREAEAALEVAEAVVASERAALDKAEADLANARAGRAVAAAQTESARVKAQDAARDLERKRALAGRATLAQSELDRALAGFESAAALLRGAEAEQRLGEGAILAAEAGYRMAEASLQHAEAAVKQQAAVLEQARIDLARTVITAPIDGVVISRDVDRGQTVAASLEAPTLFTIAQDLRLMEVRASVDEADIGRVRVGQKARFTVDAYPDRTFDALVKEIRKAPQVIQNVVTYTVALSTRNADLALLPGMTAIIRIVVEEAEDVLQVPHAALRYRPADGAAVRVVTAGQASAAGRAAVVWILNGDDTPVPVDVILGRSNDSAMEVVAGPLQEGQPVIVGSGSTPQEWWSFGFRWSL